MVNDASIKKLEAAFGRAIKTLPKVLGNEMVNFAKDSFRRQGFLDSTVERWRPRRGKRDNGRAILIKSGRLRRGWRVTKATAEIIGIGNDVPYAKAHNDGFNGTVKVPQHTRKLFGKEKRGTGRISPTTGRERTRTVLTVKGSVTVQAHTRRMRMPHRRMIGNSQYLIQRLRRVAAAQILKQLNNG